MRVLIVEDHPLMRLNLQQALAEFIVVGTAPDGEEALVLARTTDPELILLDLGLPVLSGTEVIRQLKQELPKVRILVLTSHDEDESLFGALAAGADGYCLKGISNQRLISALQAVREGVAWLDPEVADRVLRDLHRIPSGANPLSERELEVLKLVAEGLSNPEIGQQLYITSGTVRSHVSNILAKLGVNDRVQAAVRAMREGWIN
jgi:DNA-binding NarL/FixJ family response regulator